MIDERPLHIRQAEGLRQLADLIEQHPEMAHMLRYGLSNIMDPVSEQPRETLTEFCRMLTEAGVSFTVNNGSHSCDVYVEFGAVKVRMYALAERMANQTPKPEYAPLEVGGE